MRISRFYQNIPLNIGSSIQLDARTANHAIRVLRLHVDSPLILFNGKGGEYETCITHITKRDVTVSIKKCIERTVESLLKIHLGQSIARGEKMDFIIQKAVELGVHTITPLFSAYSNVQLQGERLQKKLMHWQAIAISACEQCGRTIVPEICFPQTIYEWISSCDAPYKFTLDPTATVSLQQVSQPITYAAVLIGPEGGLNDLEISHAQQHHFQSIRLGPRILRTETAPLATIAILQSRWGDLG